MGAEQRADHREEVARASAGVDPGDRVAVLLVGVGDPLQDAFEHREPPLPRLRGGPRLIGHAPTLQRGSDITVRWDGLLAELVTEGATAATEVREAHPAAAGLLERHFTRLAHVSHEELKVLSADARPVVRTGEARPYAHVPLRCGVFS
ncbi:RbsD/FucU domain-containing protein [Streptomyces sp. NPDC088812]|uniref:RbsD/FucU domain-containing protein n=1 Tax=Streptomyces sp. NPDC088812 TaxID=3365905 RepID=UPI00382A0A95